MSCADGYQSPNYSIGQGYTQRDQMQSQMFSQSQYLH